MGVLPAKEGQSITLRFRVSLAGSPPASPVWGCSAVMVSEEQSLKNRGERGETMPQVQRSSKVPVL